MANTTSVFQIEAQLRPCLVHQPKERGMITDPVPALWHCWTNEAEVVAPSIMRGGHNGGQLAHTFALVEFADGTVGKVHPERVKFLDTGEKFFKHIHEYERGEKE